MKTKVVFIAHPVSGDIEGNLKKVKEILRRIHSENIIPIFPSFTTRRYLTPDPKDRELAATHIRTYFERKFVDELWLYGNRITDGMWREVKTAVEHKIPVVAKTRTTKAALDSSPYCKLF